MDNIQTRVGLIIQIFDGLTERPLQDRETEAWLSTETSVLIKKDGYYLAMEPIQPRTRLTIQASGYQREELEVWKIMETGMLCQVYLTPDKHYPLTTECYGILGKAVPGTRFMLVYSYLGKQGEQVEERKENVQIQRIEVITDESGEFVYYWKRWAGRKQYPICKIWNVEGECLQQIDLQPGKRIEIDCRDGGVENEK